MTLFEPFSLRDVKFRNRVCVSPMCQYSAQDGLPNDWHLVHLGSRAVGGAALVLSEATAVEPVGRISPGDTGIYTDEQAAAWGRITSFIFKQGSIPGIQLAHAGRKASRAVPWRPDGSLSPEEGGWHPIVGPSPIPFASDFATPKEMGHTEISGVKTAFRSAAVRSLEAGFQVVEIHAAHGYLLHEFLSPISNQRKDGYGGPFENRIRLLCEVCESIREVWPERFPLFVRVSASDYVDGGWSIDETVELSRVVKGFGVDLIDVSSGGNVAHAKIPVGPGYQVPFAARIRREAGISVGAVGLITSPDQAERIVAEGEADMVLLARELLRDPYWPRRAAVSLGVHMDAPAQYGRAW